MFAASQKRVLPGFGLSLGTSLLFTCLILLLPIIVRIMAYGWTDDPGQIELTVTLSRIIYPFIALLSLAALVMGGFPPLDGPYGQMLQVTTATHAMAMANAASAPSTATTSQPSKEPSGEPPDEPDWSQVQVSLTEAQTRQFVTLYQALQGFDDRAAQAQLRCPRLCFVGSADEIDYDQRWGGVQVSLAGPVIRRRAELEALGWEVRVLEGLDHIQAMQAVHVLPILRPWLAGRLGT